MKRFLLLPLLLGSTAYAGDWASSFMTTLGNAYKGMKAIDYSEDRWELSECEKFGAFLTGHYGWTTEPRVQTQVGSISAAQFWKTTNAFKGKTIDFGLGKGIAILGKSNQKPPYLFQEIIEPKNFKGHRFFVGLAHLPALGSAGPPILCTAVQYPE